MTTNTQKSIVKDLDRAAGRAESVNQYGATSKQTWFLAKLILDAGLDAYAVDCGCTQTQAILTSKRASDWIKEFLKEKDES